VNPFSVHLARLMTEAGLTQADIARRSGCSKSAVSRFVSGERTPDVDVAVRLAKALGVPVCELCGTPCKG
jgi:transcriptional regulator with XRE-family HTH domain